MKIEGAGYPLSKIFNDDFLFTIPNYQRPYAWTTDETGQLLDDLLAALEDEHKEINQMNPYFLGNIVLIKNGRADAQVIDGQQRLTTLTILLSVLRELLDTENLNKYICQPRDEFSGSPARPRLLLRDRDQDFFQDYIQDAGGIVKLQSLPHAKLTDSQRNIAQNACLLMSKLSQELPEIEQLKRLTQFILQQCYLVAVSTPDLDSAYRIFSVLNNRGLDLSVTDILKADILGKIANQKALEEEQRLKEEQKYTQKWEDLEEDLGREAFTELFSHIRMIYAQKKQQQKVIKEFEEYVLPKVDTPQKFVDTILEPFATAFDDINKLNCSANMNRQEINQLFHWLHQIDHFDWKSPAILYLSRHQNQPDLLLSFFTNLERLAASLMIRRANINERIYRYTQLLKAIEANEDLSNSQSPLQLTTSETHEVLEILNGNLYQMTKIRLYVLTRLDVGLSDVEPNYDPAKVSIEHVLPQNPAEGSKWLKWFPTLEERLEYVHRLSNLVLLSRSKNSQAQNYDFDRKKEIYCNNKIANFALTIQARNETEWTKDVIERRQKALVQKLRGIWRL